VALEERLHGVTLPGHAQVANDPGVFVSFLFALQVEPVRPPGIGARADQDELGVGIVEQPDVPGLEAAAMELLLQPEARLRPDSQLVLDLARLLRQFQRINDVHPAVSPGSHMR
jgi:hypothetical protein